MGCKISKGSPLQNERDGIVSSSVESRGSVLSSKFVYSSFSNSDVGHDTDGVTRSGSKYKYIVAGDRPNSDQTASITIESLRLGANLVGLNLQASTVVNADTNPYKIVRNSEAMKNMLSSYFQNTQAQSNVDFQDRYLLANFLSSCAILSRDKDNHDFLSGYLVEVLSTKGKNMREIDIHSHRVTMAWMKQTLDAINVNCTNKNENNFVQAIVSGGLADLIIKNMLLICYELFGKNFDINPGSTKVRDKYGTDSESFADKKGIIITPEICHEAMSSLFFYRLNAADTFAGEDVSMEAGIDNTAEAKEQLTTPIRTTTVNKNAIASGWKKPPLAKRGNSNQLSHNEEGSDNNCNDGDVPPLQLSNLIGKRKSSVSAEDQLTISGRFTPLHTISNRGTFSTRSSRRQQLRQLPSSSNRSLLNKTPTAMISPLNPTPSSPSALASTSRSLNTQGSNTINSQQPVMPSLRLPLFRVENSIQESVRTPFTPTRRGRYTYNDVVTGSHSRTSRGNLKTFGDPKNLLKDMATKAGELCVAKDLWALVAHRRRIRATHTQKSTPREETSNGSDHVEIDAKLMGLHVDKMWTLLLDYFDCLTSFFQVGKLDSDWDPLIKNFISQVDTITFNTMVGMNKDSNLRVQSEAMMKLFAFMRQLGETESVDCIFESSVQKRTKMIAAASAIFMGELRVAQTHLTNTNSASKEATALNTAESKIVQQKIIRSLKGLGFEQGLTMSMLNQFYIFKLNNGGNLLQTLDSSSKELLLKWRDECCNVYATLSSMQQEHPTTKNVMNRRIRDILVYMLSHEHANSCGTMLSIINKLLCSYDENCNDDVHTKSVKAWLFQNFVTHESFMLTSTLYLELLLRFCLPSQCQSTISNLVSSNIGDTKNNCTTVIVQFKKSLLSALSFFSHCCSVLTKWCGFSSSEMCEGAVSTKHLLCQIFDPSCSTAHAWVNDFCGEKKLQAVKSSGSYDLYSIVLSMLSLKAAVLNMCSKVSIKEEEKRIMISDECILLYRSISEDNVSFHYMVFMKLYNSVDFTDRNIKLCIRHLKILLEYVYAAALQYHHGLKSLTMQNRYSQSVGSDESIIQWNDVTNLFFQLRFVNFFLRELSLESDYCKVASKVKETSPDVETIQNLAPALTVPAFDILGAQEGNDEADRSYMENAVDDTIDALETSWDSEESYGDLPVENDFSNSSAPPLGINIKPLLSVSLASTSKLELSSNTSNIKPLSFENISKVENSSTLPNKSLGPSLSLKIPLNITKGGSDDTQQLGNDDDKIDPLVQSTTDYGLKDDMAFRRDKIKLYHNDELHTLILQILVLLSIECEGGSLDPRYCPRLPVINESRNIGSNDSFVDRKACSRKLNLPFVLHYHLNNPQNSSIVQPLYEAACEYSLVIGQGPKRFVQLLCCQIFDEKASHFESSLNFSSTLISSGAFGTVHKNKYCNPSTGTSIDAAIKCVPLPKSRYNRSYIVDIFSEVAALEVLSTSKNEGFVEILDYGVSRDVGYCIVMRCYSKTLKQWRLGWDNDEFSVKKENENLRRKSKNDLLKQCLEYFKMVVASVYEMHKNGVCHYDLKCDNVLLSDDNSCIKIVDFGEAHVRPGWHGQNMYSTVDRGTECIKSPEMLTVCHAGNKDRDEYDRRRKNGKYHPLISIMIAKILT